MDKLLYYTGISLGVGVTAIIAFLFGVPYFKDPLVLKYKKDSEKMKKVLESTNLKSLVFTTCWAGTISPIQMFLMSMIEILYLNFMSRVKFHREVFKFNDGGQSALDWGFEMP